MLRRLHPEQPESFAFTAANQQWAEAQITKYPEGRQASAVIPLLWRAQEQEGWLSRPAIESVADMLGMAYIRVLEVASFYFMFQLQPVGSVAHIQVCGTTSCMICGAEDLIAVCKDKIAAKPHELSADGKLSWEEVECLGSCANAPMAQIGKDYYEDLTAESFGRIIDDLAAGKVPTPGPQNGRYAAEPLKGLTSLTEYDSGRTQYNASVQLASDLGDTVKRIDGTEVPILTPWLGKDGKPAGASASAKPPKAPEPPKPAVKQASEAKAKPAEVKEDQPQTLAAARDGQADDLKMLKGVGPKLEQTLNELGFYHFDQIAAWTPEQVAWVDARLKFKGRIERDGWIEQAAKLAAGEETEFAKRAKKDGTYED
ncbi:NADH-quinone oxidoreductase subunit NuoE [Ruegeria atlantica]|uniref:NADH-quinone oxidoreductase subunit NuoE n=1 Tax=Ruegeria atlantica TaxID=81569 RepID=UPI00147B31FF|nr:NADH-quinone oxidoreductase subunit NuoE [Ruegeria atlantica]